MRSYFCTYSTNFISPHLVPSLLCGRGQNSSLRALLNDRSHTQALLVPCKALSEGAFLKAGFCFHFLISGLQSDSEGLMTRADDSGHTTIDSASQSSVCPQQLLL